MENQQKNTPKDLYCIDYSQLLYIAPGLSQLILSKFNLSICLGLH